MSIGSNHVLQWPSLRKINAFSYGASYPKFLTSSSSGEGCKVGTSTRRQLGPLPLEDIVPYNLDFSCKYTLDHYP
jgi:hypothetical protein